jgi:hypothetical protein
MIDTQMMEKSSNSNHRYQPLVFVGRQQIHTFPDEPLAKRRKTIHSSSPSRSATGTKAVASGTHQQIHAMYTSVQRHLEFKSSTACTGVNERFVPIAMAVD